MSKTAIAMIQEERQRQVAKGYNAAHDDEHEDGELAAAAASFAAVESKHARSRVRQLWPFDDHYSDMENSTIRNLAKAGALIVAEMERVQRVEQRDRGEQPHPVPQPPECIAEGHDMGDCCDIDCPADVAKLIAALNETASSLVFDALRQDYARDALPDDLAAMLVTLLAIADMIEIDLIALVKRKIQ